MKLIKKGIVYDLFLKTFIGHRKVTILIATQETTNNLTLKVYQ